MSCSLAGFTYFCFFILKYVLHRMSHHSKEQKFYFFFSKLFFLPFRPFSFPSFLSFFLSFHFLSSSFLPSLPSTFPFSFSLNELARFSTTKSGDRCICLTSDFRGKSIQSLTIKNNVSYRIFIYSIFQVEDRPLLFLCFWKFLP